MGSCREMPTISLLSSLLLVLPSQPWHTPATTTYLLADSFGDFARLSAFALAFSAWMSLSLTYSFIHLPKFLLSSQLLTLETHLSQPFLASPTGFTTPVSKSIYFFCISVTNLRAGRKKKKSFSPLNLAALNPGPNIMGGT